MCGIVAYTGHREAYPILKKGLERLEYRGYDSAGVALQNGSLRVYKKMGKVADLAAFVGDKSVDGSVGIGHTRWATHGVPNDINAHPHQSQSGDLVMVHNGIIENYGLLKEALLREGYAFNSETDTEILVQLIEALQKQDSLSLEEAVRAALTRVVGAYAIVVMDSKDPNKLVAARKGSPLVIGIGDDGDYFVGSDATPIVEYTQRVIYLQDEEIAVITPGEKVHIVNITNEVQTPFIHQLDMKLEQLEKGGYEHFMLKEIYEQPTTIFEGMRGRFNAEEGWVSLGGVQSCLDRFLQADRIIIVACGTSWHSGLIAEYLIEDLARLPVEVEYASEFRYRNPVISEKDVVIAISQSGETADTLAALELAKSKGALTYGVVNVVGSSIARLTDAGSYIHAGPEIGVASTKAFTGQVTPLTLLALMLAKHREKISEAYYKRLVQELADLPKKVEQALACNAKVEYISGEIKDRSNALFLGRGYNFPVALEGALKLKEISYVHAEGYPAAEMKHGPIALIDAVMPVVVIATNRSAFEKIVSNIQDVKGRQVFVIAIVNE
ncbi:MAG: glutamine--fructose-6-phosphate transaminase (isomerizing), partial [Bacteroidota bacterium]